MDIWLILLCIMAAIVFGVDYLFRRKKWKDNSKEEKVSLLLNMFSVGPYMFFSAVGMLLGIASGSPENAVEQILYDATLAMAGIYFIVAIVAVISSFIFRKIGKPKISSWINIAALLYIVLVLLVNVLAGGSL